MAEPTLKCLEVEPSSDSRYDTQVVELKDGTWKDALSLIEMALDRQYNERPWYEIEVTVRCRSMTRNELDDLREEG